MTHRLARPSLLAAAAAAAALIAPVSAGAHGSVYTSPSFTATTAAPDTLVAGPTNYLVSNHGHNAVLRETNGLTAGGMLNFKVLPSAWRNKAGRTKTEWFAQGDTGAQPHATCSLSGQNALTQADVLAWQDADPFYTYVPWQSTAAGLGDDEHLADWIRVIKERTGVDLTGANAATAKLACEGKGGTYFDADAVATTGAALASGDIALVADPLKAEIEGYKKTIAANKTTSDAALLAANEKTATAERSLAAANARAAGAEAAATAASAKAATAEAALKAAQTPLAVKVVSTDLAGASIAKQGLAAQVTGAPNASVIVSVTVTSKAQRKHGLPTKAIATKTVKLDATGSASVTLIASPKTNKALGKLKASLELNVTATFAASASTTATAK